MPETSARERACVVGMWVCIAVFAVCYWKDPGLMHWGGQPIGPPAPFRGEAQSSSVCAV